MSSDVLAKDLAERKSENPLAYRSNCNENELSEKDLKRKWEALIESMELLNDFWFGLFASKYGL